MSYALIDAAGHDTGNKSPVYSAHQTIEAARAAARRWNGNGASHQVQIIEGDLRKGDIVYMDAVGSVYPPIAI